MSSMTAKMATIAMNDMHPMGNCKDCGGTKDGIPAGACSAYCTGMVAVSPELASFDDVPTGKQQYRARVVLTGHHVRPDPYPPKSILLS